ncbi:MAG: hypothetical protein NW216_12410 [Hyphomicrobium sp.]|nr:hypothetical protein [Hyphomicrobium sp.]
MNIGTAFAVVWPFLVAAAAWAIAVWALSEPDEQARVVKRLTKTGPIPLKPRPIPHQRSPKPPSDIARASAEVKPG